MRPGLLLMALCALGTQAVAAEGRRVALVIGNANYSAVEKLTNPVNDADLVAKSLKGAAFTSIEVKHNLGKVAMEAALRDFGQKADGAELAVIYYAGHGIEFGGQNYLIPTDARLQRDRDVDIEAIRLDTLLSYAEGAKLRVVVLDACRNNPFVSQLQRSTKSRSIGRGLAAVEPEGETLIVYAAKAGATAADGAGANSPFAQALARHLTEPGVEINMVFRRVRDDVLASTGRTQEPFTYGSLSGNEFYFVAAKNKSGAQPAAAPPVAAAQTSNELEYWRGAVTADTEPAYRAYLKRYPRGEYSELANENIKRLTAKPASGTQQVASVAPATQTQPPAQQRSTGPGMAEGLGAIAQIVTALKTDTTSPQARANLARQQQQADQAARAELSRQQALERQAQQQAAREQQQLEQQARNDLARQQSLQRQASAQQPTRSQAMSVAGVWRGEYTCAQHVFAMQMTLQQDGSGSLRGRIDFTGTPASPGPT
ncbi:MAG: caspase family protein, partial [Pseudomonadota bacterium]